jgi:hypothetical protein
MAGRAWTGLLLGLMVGTAAPASAQVPTSPPVFELGDNFPNPFFPATSIPFVLTSEACTDGHIPLVTLEIYNVLVQVVAVPELQTGGRERVRGLRLRCGSYVAYWSGRYLDDEREVTPGVYYYRLTVDGQSQVKKMIVRMENQPPR